MSRLKIVDSTQSCLEILAATKASSTVRMYLIGLNKFVSASDAQGLQYVDELSVGNFIAVVGELATKGLAPRSRRVYISALSFYMNWLVAMGHWDPTTQDLERYKLAVQQWSGKPRAGTKMVKPEEIEQVINEAVGFYEKKNKTIISTRNVVIPLFLFSSGCRVSELISLRMEDIDLDERTAIVTGKGEKTRTLYFNLETTEWLERYWGKRVDNHSAKNPVVARHDKCGRQAEFISSPLSTGGVRRVIAILTEAAGFEKGYITPHSFRHAFAIKMLSKTGNLALVQDLLGHSSPETTRVYARFTQEKLAEEYAKVWNT